MVGCNCILEHISMDPSSPTAQASKAASVGILAKIRSSKRRFIQQTLTKLGKAESTDDHEYQALRQRNIELVTNVENVLTHMKSFVTSLVSLGYGCTLLGDDMIMVRTDKATREATASYGTKTVDANVNEFSKSMIDIDVAARELASSMLTATVVVSMQSKLDELHLFKKEMDHRENLKLDYDSAVRKAWSFHSSVALIFLSTVASHCARASRGHRFFLINFVRQLKAAQIRLTEATEVMVVKMKKYEEERPTMLQNEINEFRKLQVAFFQLCVTSFAPPRA
ncbi:Aste57867_9670 [Aphanomyces stellatus]|uniref:Aste57867_9670 protein n=1 Tax=Aphanomyces stellatus TaxID=120398 RepID=A0A485KNR5_9STRA|nr:hypothetical protein As57867_009632 [Aphanomyces stellatus]VFT86549.1 Aste57867_9670 [Aphanomyces stellatus]